MKPAFPTGCTTVAVLALMVSPAMAVNKCVDENGLVVYQSAPCPTSATSSALPIQKTAPAPVSTEGSEELKRIQQTAAAMERERRLVEIDREIKRLEGRIIDHRSAMDGEMAQLQRKKQFARNNLAGATWEKSISEEMNAVAQKYDALIRNDQSRIEQLQADAERLRKTE